MIGKVFLSKLLSLVQKQLQKYNFRDKHSPKNATLFNFHPLVVLCYHTYLQPCCWLQYHRRQPQYRRRSTARCRLARWWEGWGPWAPDSRATSAYRCFPFPPLSRRHTGWQTLGSEEEAAAHWSRSPRSWSKVVLVTNALLFYYLILTQLVL